VLDKALKRLYTVSHGPERLGQITPGSTCVKNPDGVVEHSARVLERPATPFGARGQS